MTLTFLRSAGWDHQTLSQTGAGLADTVSGGGTTTTIFTPGFRGSEAGMECHPTVAASSREELVIAAQTQVAIRFHYQPVTAFPASNGTVLSFLAGGATAGVLRITSAGQLQYSANGSSGFTNGPTLVANQVYCIELQFDVSTNPWVMRMRVDQIQYADNQNAVAATTITRVRPGTTSASGPDFVGRYDNLSIYSYTVAATDWVGDGRVWFLTAAFTPGHTVGADTFRVTTNNGGAFTTLVDGEETSYDAIDNWPIVADGGGTVSWIDNSAGADATKFAAYFFRNFPLALVNPKGVNVLVAVRASAAGGTENFDMRLCSGASESATKVFSGAISSTTTSYKNKAFALAPDDASAWTAKLLRGTFLRFYGGGPYTQVPRLRALAMEVDAPLADNMGKGFNDHPALQSYYGLSGNAARTALFDKLAIHGTKWLRMDIRWDAYEPLVKGSYDAAYVARVNESLSLAAARGINVIANTLGTPTAWAGPGTDTKPTLTQDYVDWLVHVASTHTGVAVWEVWNEQNDHTNFWTSTDADYIALLQPSYRAVRKANPQVMIIAGGSAQCDPTYWTGLYGLGLRGYTDVLNVHNYGTHSNFTPETNVGATQYFLDPPLVRAVGIANLDYIPVWSTEWGWSSHADSTHLNGFALLCDGVSASPNDNANSNQGVSLVEQADYYTRAYNYGRANFVDTLDGYSYMEVSCYYLFRCKGTAPSCVHTDMRGLYNINANPATTLTPKPIAFADLAGTDLDSGWGVLPI